MAGGLGERLADLDFEDDIVQMGVDGGFEIFTDCSMSQTNKAYE